MSAHSVLQDTNLQFTDVSAQTGTVQFTSNSFSVDKSTTFLSGITSVDNIAIDGTSSGTMTIAAPATVTSYTITVPPSQASGVLQNDGTGTLSWTTPQWFNAYKTVTQAMNTLTPAGAAWNALGITSNGIAHDGGTGFYLTAGKVYHIIFSPVASGLSTTSYTVWSLRDKATSTQTTPNTSLMLVENYSGGPTSASAFTCIVQISTSGYYEIFNPDGNPGGDAFNLVGSTTLRVNKTTLTIMEIV